MTKIFDHNEPEKTGQPAPTPAPGSSWDKVPVSNEEEVSLWLTGDEPAIHTVAAGQTPERQAVLDHCRQYPERWEILEPTPEEAMGALRYAHQHLRSENSKAIIVLVDEGALLTEAARADRDSPEYTEAATMLSEIARLGRSRSVHVLLGMGEPVS